MAGSMSPLCSPLCLDSGCLCGTIASGDGEGEKTG